VGENLKLKRSTGVRYVNNRFEGNALETIAAMVEQAGAV
jgi:hypothetical protein